jgi:hypothetical protein
MHFTNSKISESIDLEYVCSRTSKPVSTVHILKLTIPSTPLPHAPFLFLKYKFSRTKQLFCYYYYYNNSYYLIF